MEFEPSVIVFREVRLNQAYTTSVCLSNPLSAAVDFQLRPSNPRYTISPTKIHLNAGQSIVITIKLFLNHYPNLSKGIKGLDDYVFIKSTYFDQKIPIQLTLSSTLTRSRSPSPSSMAGVRSSRDQLKDKPDLVQELQGQINKKDQQIMSLQETIGQLQAKYPNLQDIIQSRISQERNIFEEKSEKILRILKKKDEQIYDLQESLHQKEQEYEELSRSAFEKSAINNDPTSTSSSLSQLQELNQSLQQTLTKKEQQYQQLSSQYQQLNQSMHELQSQSRHESTVQQELRGLREKTMDQSDQIEALLGKLSEYQNDSNAYDNTLSKYKQENEQLKVEKQRLLKKAKELESSQEQLQQSYDKLLTHESNKLLHKQPSSSQNQPSSQPSETLTPRQYEPQVEGGYATSTPRQYHLPAQSLPKDTNLSSIQLYKEIAEDYEQKHDDIKRQLQVSQSAEDQCRQMIEELREQLTAKDHELLEIKSKLQDNYHPFPPDHMIKPTLLSQNNVTYGQTTEEVHQWWAYVYHELQKYHEQQNNASDRIPGNVEYQSEDLIELTFHMNKLKESIRQQSIEICTVRQELLGHKLQQKQLQQKHMDEIQLYQHDITQLKTLLRHQKQEKEIKLTELQATIKSLSQRSELHQQITHLKQDLETEKLSKFHLQCEVEHYHDLIQIEQRKNVTLTKELSQLQGKIEANELILTFYNIPGVSAIKAIELMTTELIHTKENHVKLEHHVQEFEQEIKQLTQEKLILQEEKEKLFSQLSVQSTNNPDSSSSSHNVPIAGSSEQKPSRRLSRPGRSVSPSPVRKSVSFPSQTTSSSSAGGNSNHNLPIPVNLSVTNDMTAKGLLQTYDMHQLLHQLHEQEEEILRLTQELEETNKQLTKKYYPINQFELVPLEQRIEFDTLTHQYEITKQRIAELQDENKQQLLQITNLQKENLELKTSVTSASSSSSASNTKPVSSPHLLPKEETNTSTKSIEWYEEHDKRQQKELQECTRLLRERTTQLKILMESFESLQLPGISAHSFEPKTSLDESMSYFQSNKDTSNSSIAGVNLTWVTQGLVKRVVELTTELASQVSSNHLYEIKQQELIDENKTTFEQYLHLKNKSSQLEHEVQTLLSEKQKYQSESYAYQQTLLNQQTHYQQELHDCHHLLENQQIELTNTKIYVEELLKRCQTLEKQELFDILQTFCPNIEESTPKTFEEEPFFTSEETKKEDQDIKQVIYELLTLWKEKFGVIPSKQPTFTNENTLSPKLTRQEQEFYQQITNLITSTHQKYMSLVQTKKELHQYAKEQEKKVMKLQLEIASSSQQYLRISKKCQSYEQNHLQQGLIQQTQSFQLIALLKKHLKEEQITNQQLLRDNFTLQQTQQTLQETNEQSQQQLRQLNIKVYQYESSNHAFYQQKDQLHQQVINKIDQLQLLFKSWCQIELPRLVSGLPVTETALSSMEFPMFSPENMTFGLSMGGDYEKTYALTQALCAEKTQQIISTSHQLELEETNRMMKQRIQELEEIIQKWSNELSLEVIPSPQNPHVYDTIERAQERTNNSLNTQELLQTLQTNKEQLLNYEEAIIEYKGKHDIIQQQCHQFELLLQTNQEETEKQRDAHIQEIQKLRWELENQHFEEYRTLRETYEKDRQKLLGELRNIAEAVEEAKLSDLMHLSDWPSLMQSNQPLPLPPVPPQPPSELNNIREQQVSSVASSTEELELQKLTEEIRKKMKDSSSRPTGIAESQELYALDSSASMLRTDDEVETPRKSSFQERMMNNENKVNEKPVEKATNNNEKKKLKTRLTDKPRRSSSSLKASQQSSPPASSSSSSSQSSMLSTPSKNSLVSSPSSTLATDQSPSDPSLASFSAANQLKEVQMDNLLRMIDLERRKTMEAKQEIKELEAMLTSQQQQFKQMIEVQDKDRTALLTSSSQALHPAVTPLLQELLAQLQLLFDRLGGAQHSDGSHFLSVLRLTKRILGHCMSSSSTENKEAAYLSDTDNNNNNNNSHFIQQMENILLLKPTGSSSSSLLVEPLLTSNNTSTNNNNNNMTNNNNPTPERNLFLLRDVRQRVDELTKQYNAQHEEELAHWQQEQRQYVEQIEHLRLQLSGQEKDYESEIQKMKRDYEELINQKMKLSQAEVEHLMHVNSELQAIITQQQEKITQLNRLSVNAVTGTTSNTATSTVFPSPPTAPVFTPLTTVSTATSTSPSSSSSTSSTSSNSAASSFKQPMAEFLQLQQLLNQSHALLEEKNQELQNIHQQSTKEINELKQQFLSFRQANSKLVSQLEEQLTSMADPSFLQNTSTNDLSSIKPPAFFLDLEDKYRQLEMKYQSKCVELNTVLTMMNQPVKKTSSDNELHSQKQQLHEEITQARLQTYAQELAVCQQKILVERKQTQQLQQQIIELQTKLHQQQQTQLQTLPQTHLRPAQTLDNPSFPRDNSRPKPSNTTTNKDLSEYKDNTSLQELLQEFDEEFVVPKTWPNDVFSVQSLLIHRINLLRRQAKEEISRLLQENQQLTQQITQINDTMIKESTLHTQTTSSSNKPTKQTLNELKQQLQQQKEENQRKQKIISALKEAKEADSNALETWKQEVKQLEETIRRLQRTLTSKEAYIKDMKQKYEQQEEKIHVIERQAGFIASSSPAYTSSAMNNPSEDYGVSLVSMSIPEMRGKIKELELERNRQKVRIQAYKDKIQELEQTNQSLQQDSEKINKLTEKYEQMKASNQRKESQLLHAKEQNQQLQQTISQLKEHEQLLTQDNEKRIKQLQRQIEIAIRNQKEYEEELRVMRNRLSSSSEMLIREQTMHANEPSNYNTSNYGSNNTSNNTNYTNYNTKMNTRTNTTSASTSSTSAPVNPTSGKSVQFMKETLPSSLSESSHDIEDVLNALGVEVQVPKPMSSASNNTFFTSQSQSQQQPLPPSDLLSRINQLSNVFPALDASQLSSNSSQSSSSLRSTQEASNDVEKRLQALVQSALQSPTRP